MSPEVQLTRSVLAISATQVQRPSRHSHSAFLDLCFEAKPVRYFRAGIHTILASNSSSADVRSEVITDALADCFICFIHSVAGSKIIRAAFIEVFVGEHAIVTMGNWI